MHIPDGYLSPSTCAALYGAAAPFWYVALQRMKRLAGTQMIPLISVFAAFSFVVMMFNLPLPGGTTGHAVGIGIAAIVVGPWGAIASISIALAIQALFFGDGGLTALGANCFNMGVVGSLVAYAVYAVAAGGAAVQSGRRVFAAGLAGYCAINAAALCAAIEFGVQPLWFHDQAGVPLYCPYPLQVSIPAMMIGHLTFAGLAELTIAAGIVKYLQASEPSLLGAGSERENAGIPRAAWLVLLALVVLSPLGILAAGSAWGEWTPAELGKAPAGLLKLSTLWSAPIARYAPSFVGNVWVGYCLSAVVGIGAILLVGTLLNRLLRRGPKARRGFVEQTVVELFQAVELSLHAEKIAGKRGFLQSLDPRVKLASVLLLVAASASARRLTPLVFLLGGAVCLGLLSRVSARTLAIRAWLPALGFGGLMAVPAIFLVQGGEVSAAFLIARLLTAATLSLLLILTTEWNRVLKALRFFHVPIAVVVILGMTYRYLFVLLRTAQDMFEARRARLVGLLEDKERQRLASASAGILLEKSLALSQDIHLAMQARGFRGEVYLLEESPLFAQDWLKIAAVAALAVSAVAWGR